jgi:hypothetical protein
MVLFLHHLYEQKPIPLMVSRRHTRLHYPSFSSCEVPYKS